MASTTETGQATGTKDKDYNLLWFTEQSLSNALRLEEYIQDAERDGDNDLAEFFRRTEPHSPLSYTLDEAVRRGRMSWPDLLSEVVADVDTRNNILTSLGIRPPPPAAEE